MASNAKKNDKPGKGDHTNNNGIVNRDTTNDKTDDANIAEPGISDNMALCMVIHADARLNLDDKWAAIAAECGVSQDFAKQRMGKIQAKYLEANKGYVPPPVNTLKRNRVEKIASPSPQMTQRGVQMPKDDRIVPDETPAPARPHKTVAKPAAREPPNRRFITKRTASQRTGEFEDLGKDVPSSIDVQEEQGRSMKRAKTQAKRDAKEDENELYD